MDHVTKFTKESGLKVLALASLDACEYSLVLHLLNTAASGHVQWITTIAELASLTRHPLHQIEQAVQHLESIGILECRFNGHTGLKVDREYESMRIRFEFDTSKWNMQDAGQPITSYDAIIYPFVKGLNTRHTPTEQAPLELSLMAKDEQVPSWEEVVRLFSQRAGDKAEDDEKSAADGAKLLLRTHPEEQIMLLLDYFGDRLPSLSLLASSWDQFVHQYEVEHLKIDFSNARQKHADLEKKLRQNAKEWLQDSLVEGYSSLEVGLLKLLISHKRPRRQLYWAYQTKERYPRLKDFFEQNKAYMLAVTSKGNIVKKQP
ncbi:MAG: hypothetical protein OXT67_08910 [Zetaproteobacteria bacterium]|nr:hypothetical protein [Zetaproteobacteria bacterium]